MVPKAYHGQENIDTIEEDRVQVPPIGQGPDQGQGVHRPIEAELIGAEEEPRVGGRQVEEGERPGEEMR